MRGKVNPDLFESVSKVVVSICEVGFELYGVVEGLDGVGEVSEVVVAAAQVAVRDGEVCIEEFNPTILAIVAIHTYHT